MERDETYCKLYFDSESGAALLDGEPEALVAGIGFLTYKAAEKLGMSELKIMREIWAVIAEELHVPYQECLQNLTMLLIDIAELHHKPVKEIATMMKIAAAGAYELEGVMNADSDKEPK